jgi:hypothetical protein
MANAKVSTKTRTRLKALFLIVDWDKLNVVSAVFARESCLLSFVSNGKGTASSEITSLLGIGSTEKAVFICLVQSTDTQHIIQEVRRAMGSRSAGAGIAFSVPLGGVTARILSMFEEHDAERAAENSNTQKETKMKAIEINNEMIISILKPI